MPVLARSMFFRTQCFLVLIALSATASAQQVPDYDAGRWNGWAAMTPTQGYGQGSPLTLTWGFMAPGTTISDNYGTAGNNLQTRLNTIYGSQSVWQPLFQSVFDRWSSISGLTYQYVTYDDGAILNNSSFQGGVLNVRPDVRIGGKTLDGNPPSGTNTLAYNYFPVWGDMVIDTGDTFFNTTTNNSIRLRNVVTHEHGHGLGMGHIESNGSGASNGAFSLEPFINTNFDGPQYHDILAVQRMYGDAYEKIVTASGPSAGQGNDVVGRASNLGAVGSTPLRIGQSAKTLIVQPNEVDFISIDDQSDTDFYSFDVGTAGQLSVTLEALGFTYNLTQQGGGGLTPFDTNLRSDLALALFDQNGTTMLASANATGFGGDEFIFFNLLSGGRYFIRVTGIDNADALNFDIQFYGLMIGFSPVPEPATLAMIGIAAVFAGVWRRLRRVSI